MIKTRYFVSYPVKLEDTWGITKLLFYQLKEKNPIKIIEQFECLDD